MVTQIDNIRRMMSITIMMNELSYYQNFNNCVVNFALNKSAEVFKIYSLLDFKNKSILLLLNNKFVLLFNNNKIDFTISRTGDGEILIYFNNNTHSKNIIIDDDGDIEFLCIDRKNRENSFHKYYNKNDFHEIISLI